MALLLARMKKKTRSLLKVEFVKTNTTVANDVYKGHAVMANSSCNVLQHL